MSDPNPFAPPTTPLTPPTPPTVPPTRSWAPNAYTAYGYSATNLPPTTPLTPPNRKKRGKIIAVSVVAGVTVVALVAWAVVAAIPGITAEFKNPNYSAGAAGSGGEHVSDSLAGDCFNADVEPLDTDALVSFLSCNGAHQYEVYFLYEEPMGRGGNAPLTSSEQDQRTCQGAAAGRVDGQLEIIAVPAGPDSFDNDIRSVSCLIRELTGKSLTGSHTHAYALSA